MTAEILRIIATKKKVRWLDFLRPRHHEVAGRVYTDQAFEAFRWLVKTGSEYRGEYKDHGGAWRTLSLGYSTIGTSGVAGFSTNWKEDLPKRFVAAILEEHCPVVVDAWRERYSIGLDGERMIPMLYATQGPPSFFALNKKLDALFACAERKTRRSLNSCHTKARTIFGVSLDVEPSCYSVSFRYGYARDRGSSWRYEVGAQKGGELFGDFIERALQKLNRMLQNPEAADA